jgi:hypothetical protein
LPASAKDDHNQSHELKSLPQGDLHNISRKSAQSLHNKAAQPRNSRNLQ